MLQVGDTVKIIGPVNDPTPLVTPQVIIYWVDNMNASIGRTITLEADMLVKNAHTHAWNIDGFSYLDKWLELVNDGSDAYNYAMEII